MLTGRRLSGIVPGKKLLILALAGIFGREIPIPSILRQRFIDIYFTLESSALALFSMNLSGASLLLC